MISMFIIAIGEGEKKIINIVTICYFFFANGKGFIELEFLGGCV